MFLDGLPAEILLYVANILKSESDINAFARVNRRLHNVLNSYLYSHNVQCGGSSALWWAVRHGEKKTAQNSLSEGADIHATNEKSYHRETPFYEAVRNRHNLSRWSVTKVVDNKTVNREKLYPTTLQDHDAVILLLIENGADINFRSRQGWRALHHAAWSRDEALVRLLIGKGADVEAKDDHGSTVLHMAAFGGSKAVVRLLIEEGLNVNSKDSRGRTALHEAAETANREAVQLLIENGTIIEAKDNYGSTALHYAARSGLVYSKRLEAVARLLIENGIDIEAKDNDGLTALHHAASGLHEEVVQLLIEKDADVEAKDSKGKTALHRAVSNANEAVVRLLIQNGADVEAKDNDEKTVLDQAVKRGGRVAQMLIEKLARRSSRLAKKPRHRY
jgi:ankyrin repeat protein